MVIENNVNKTDAWIIRLYSQNYMRLALLPKDLFTLRFSSCFNSNTNNNKNKDTAGNHEIMATLHFRKSPYDGATVTTSLCASKLIE